MKKILVALVLTLFTSAAVAGSYMRVPIDSIYDGDTIKTHVGTYKLPAPLNKVSIRILGIDTPENPAKSYLETGKLGRADCIKEAELALKARQFVVDMAEGYTTMKITNFKHGKYGGRWLADVEIGGVDVASALIEAGLAVEYFGGTKVKDWCL